LLKEKDNQVELARSKLNAVQAQTFTSEGTLTSLEEALADRDKQIVQLREQRDRAEKDNKEEKELHEREVSDYKMKVHTLESEVRKLFKTSLIYGMLRAESHLYYVEAGFFWGKMPFSFSSQGRKCSQSLSEIFLRFSCDLLP